MQFLKTLGAAVAFIAVYGFVDWFAGVTAPVLGPIVITALMVFLFWLMVRIAKDGL